MKYTVNELSEILNVNITTINGWIIDGIISCHSHRTGEVIKLKAEEIPGKGRGGKYYLIDANDINDFMMELYKDSYFYAWWRK